MNIHPPYHSLKRVARSLSLVAVVGTAALFLGSCNKDASLQSDSISQSSAQQATSDIASPIPTNPDAMIIPADNPMTPAKVALGKMLFFDPNVSVPFTDKKTGKTVSQISCATCHAESRGFSDMRQFSTGFNNLIGTRNAASLTNVAYNSAYSWDGKFETLEKHAPAPMFNSVEMGNNFSSIPGDTTGHPYYHSDAGRNDTLFLFKRLLSGHQAEYVTDWENAYHSANMSLDGIAKAIASFERTLVSTGSAFDAYNRGNKNAISASAKRGFQLFIDPNKANCVSCHSGYDFNGTGKDAAGNQLDPNLIYRNNGLKPMLVSGSKVYDKGRGDALKNPAYDYLFKIPTLRNVALTAPYMHDGRFATLEEVLNHYNHGGDATAGQDKNVHQLNLTQDEMSDIINFLKSLTDTKTISAMMSTDNRSPFNK